MLVDTLSALPMEHVVRVARLGHERLRQTSCLKWVTDRMTDVSFGQAVVGLLNKSDTEGAFTSTSVLKRLYGRIVVSLDNLEVPAYKNACVKIVNRIPGKLHLHVHKNRVYFIETKTDQILRSFFAGFNTYENLVYLTSVINHFQFCVDVIRDSPSMVFAYNYSLYRPKWLDDANVVKFRHSLVKDRHIVDVLRAVCGPADVDEWLLEIVKSFVEIHTFDENKEEEVDGVWMSDWDGYAVTKIPAP